MAKFKPAIQLSGMREINNDLITNFSHNWKLNNALVMKFNLTNNQINTNKISLNFDFSSYDIEMIYKSNKEPKVFIRKPALLKKTPHLFHDGSLCLYKKSNFKWKDGCSIAKEIVPLIIMWVYYYEVWQKSKKWYGKEAGH